MKIILYNILQLFIITKKMIKQQNLTNIHNINYNIKINLYSLQGGNI